MTTPKATVDICYVISHGFAARMVLQTGLIERLTERGLRVAIISPDAQDENFAALRNNPQVELCTANIKQTIWDDDYGFKRRYYLEDIHSNPVFWEKHIHSIFYSKSKHPWKRIRPLVYYSIYRLIPYFPKIRERFKERERKYLVSKKARELLQGLKPRLVVSTYPINYLEAKFLFEAKEAGMSTLIHLLSWDNITSKGIFPVIPDRFIAWGPVMYKELKAYYELTDDQIHICGVPHFDQHYQLKETSTYRTIITELGLNPDRPYLFVAMSSPRFAPHEIDIVEWLASAIESNKFGKELQLVVRPHPQNVQGAMADRRWLKRLSTLVSQRVAIDTPKLVDSNIRWSMRKSDMERLSHLLVGSSLCLNSGSTVSIDALMLDKPVILTSFDGDRQLYYWKSARRLVDYTHLKKFVAMGGAEVAYSYEELEQAIHRYLTEPAYHLERRQEARFQECYHHDGQATSRVVKAMEDILESYLIESPQK